MKRIVIGFLTVLTSATIAACGSAAPTTTSPTSGAGTSATSSAGDTSATSTAGDTGATSEADDTSATSMADDMSATSTAGDTSATTTSGSTSATSAAGDTSATTTSGSTSGTTTATGGTIVDVAGEQGNFTTLLAALQATGLDQQLSQAGEYTVFAPTDEAFQALPAGTIQALLANPTLLQQILSYHVAQGELMAADVTSATSIPTLEGNPIQVTTSGSTVTLNGTAKVTSTDIQTSNGVIHVIDQVLLPPNVTLPS